jgi:hypothetical protein
MKAGRTRSVVTNIPLIWRLRLVLHGVRLSPFAHDDLTSAQGTRIVAYRVHMAGSHLTGAEHAPMEARVNIRAASFVLRHFGLRMAEMRTDARGALLALDTRGTELAAQAHPRAAAAAGASAAMSCRN